MLTNLVNCLKWTKWIEVNSRLSLCTLKHQKFLGKKNIHMNFRMDWKDNIHSVDHVGLSECHHLVIALWMDFWWEMFYFQFLITIFITIPDSQASGRELEPYWKILWFTFEILQQDMQTQHCLCKLGLGTNVVSIAPGTIKVTRSVTLQ